MKEFNDERIKDLLENPRTSIVKEWEKYHQSQMNSLGQQANDGDPFAQRFLSDLFTIDYKVNKLINDNKVLSDYDYALKQLDNELTIVKYGSNEDLFELAKNTNFPHTLDEIYSKALKIDDCIDEEHIKQGIAQNPNIPSSVIDGFLKGYSAKNGFNYEFNDQAYTLDTLLKNPSLSTEQFESLNKIYQEEKSYFEQEELERDRNAAKAGDMDYIFN